MGTLLLACAVVLLASSNAAIATAITGTNAVSQATNSHRYLLIVETSKTMGKRIDSILSVVNGLVASHFKEQLQPGDTIGVWTYNESISAGKFPLQQWTPEGQKAFASGLSTFLKGEKYEKTPNFGVLLPAMKKLTKMSHDITFIIISSGQETVHGTPYDEIINTGFTSWRDEQQKLKMPMLTVMRAWKGQFTGCKVAPAQWEVEIPPFPKEAVLATAPQTNAPSVRTAVATPPTGAMPLVVQGHKSSLDNPAMAAPAALAALLNAEPKTPTTPSTALPAENTSTQTSTVAASQPAPVPSQAITFSPGAATNDPNGPVPASTAVPKAVPKSPVVPAPHSPAATANQEQQKPAAPTADSQKIVSKLSPFSTPVEARGLDWVPAAPEENSDSQPNVDQHQPATQRPDAQHAVKAGASHGVSPSGGDHELPTTTQAVTSPIPLAQRTLWFSGGAVFGFLMIGFVLMAKRTVKQERVSLITRSFERRGK